MQLLKRLEWWKLSSHRQVLKIKQIKQKYKKIIRRFLIKMKLWRKKKQLILKVIPKRMVKILQNNLKNKYNISKIKVQKKDCQTRS